MHAKDLTQQAPTSPRVRTGGYAVLSRALDKCRAEIAGTNGEYHFACPLDMMLFDFKGVPAADVKKLIETGSSDEDIAIWMDGTGHPKSPAEKDEWSDGIEAARPYDNPEKKDWFIGVCAEAKCDPAASTLFDFLEADDKTTFAV